MGSKFAQARPSTVGTSPRSVMSAAMWRGRYCGRERSKCYPNVVETLLAMRTGKLPTGNLASSETGEQFPESRPDVEPDLADACNTKAPNSTKLGPLRQTLTQIGSASTNLGRNPSKFGRFQPGLTHIWPTLVDVGQTSDNFCKDGPMLANLGRSPRLLLANLGQFYIGQLWSNFGRISAPGEGARQRRGTCGNFSATSEPAGFAQGSFPGCVASSSSATCGGRYSLCLHGPPTSTSKI